MYSCLDCSQQDLIIDLITAAVGCGPDPDLSILRQTLRDIDQLQEGMDDHMRSWTDDLIATTVGWMFDEAGEVND